MMNDNDSDSDSAEQQSLISDDDDDDDEMKINKPKTGCRKFSAEQIATLNAFYKNGMRGVGMKNSVFIEGASKQTGLTCVQVKGWIKKKSYRQKHAQRPGTDEELPLQKRVKLSPWQCFFKDFGKSEGGKIAMSSGLGDFNMAARTAYSNISASERDALRQRCTVHTETMTKKDIKREGKKRFLKIQKLMNDLEELGYAAFALGFFEEEVQFTSTKFSECYKSPQIIEYLHAVFIAGNPPCVRFPEAPSTQEPPSKTSQPPSSSKASQPPSSSKASQPPSSSKASQPPSSSKASQPPSSSKTSQPPSSSKTSQPPSSSKASQPPSSSKASQPPSSSKTSQPPSSSKASQPPSSSEHGQQASPETFSLLENLLDSTASSNVEDNSGIIVGSQVELSDSPVKQDPKEWLQISSVTLYVRDKQILESSIEWLNDNIIYAAQLLLQQKFHSVNGWMCPQLSKRKELFIPVSYNTPFIQILNVDKSHWITVSNIDAGNHSHSNDAVSIYDSGSPARVNRETKKCICSIMKPKTEVLHLDLINIVLQPNGSDCGVFAIACATELAHGFDPTFCYWDTEQMRKHLLLCLETGSLTRFPCGRKRRRLPLGGRVKKSFKERIYCVCRTINDVDRPMIACDNCHKYFHMDCEGLDSTAHESYEDVKWMCSLCKKDLPA